MLTENLFKTVLVAPAAAGADTLLIVSGYASPPMVRKHFKHLGAKKRIQLIIGMTSIEGIQRVFHQAFVKMAREDFRGRFECRYISTRPAVHSKAYVWLKDGYPAAAFIGSANYSQEAFLRRRELLIPGVPSAVAGYYKLLRKHSIDCLDASVEDHIRLTEFQRRQPTHRPPRPLTPRTAPRHAITTSAESITVSLLNRKGDTGKHSRLNWSQRPGRSRPNEAYIHIGTAIGNSDFFPPRGQHFTLVTDDGQDIDAVIAQGGNKAIHSFKDNSILGRYFRTRLGVAQDARIRPQDLRRYGRTNVEFQHVAEDTYFMDFSVPPETTAH